MYGSVANIPVAYFFLFLLFCVAKGGQRKQLTVN